MAQFYRYPAEGGASANPSVGTVGITAPTSATEVGGVNPSGNLEPLMVDSSGSLIVSPLTTSSTVTVVQPNYTLLNATIGSSVLPTGASTSALQTTGNTSLASIVSNQTNGTQTSIVTQPTGTNLHTVVDSSALPTGAATAANQTNASQKTQIVDGSGNVIASTSNALNVEVINFPGTQPISGTVTANQGTAAALAAAWPVEITDGTNVLGTSTHPVRIDPTGTTTQPVSATSLPLPTGASTSANQTTANSALTAIEANQTNGTQTSIVTQTTGTNLHTVVDSGSISVSNFPATQPVSGTVTVTQATGTNLHAVIDSGTVTLSGTSPISGTVTANQGTANATPWNENIAQFGGTSVSLGSKVSASSIPVVIASDQAAVPASQSGTWNINNVSGTVSLPTGAATSANQTNGTQKSQIATPTALTVTNAAITVGTTAVRLTVSGSAPASTRVVLVATPDTASTATFYIGTSTVTNSGSTRGIEIKAGQSFIANNDAGDYWIVASAASQTVTVMEQA